MNGANNIIELNNLYVTSGNRYLLQNINWEIKEGENWILFGSNGCGKTTLLSTIAGFRNWTSGTVKVFGQEYNHENIFELRKQIGWVSSSFFDKYFHGERAIDIVLSGLTGSLSKRFDISNHDIMKAHDLMEAFHLKNKIERPFDLMSKGERQNVLLARALMSDPKLLILDEPGSGLDVFARESMLQMVDALAHTGETTVLYVTHYPEEILPVFANCALMKEGAFYTKGHIEEVFTDAYMSMFVEMPVKVNKQGEKYFLTAESGAITC
jgi:iron complex transport system ATP-binding protein